jgi:hypothetical protein
MCSAILLEIRRRSAENPRFMHKSFTTLMVGIALSAAILFFVGTFTRNGLVTRATEVDKEWAQVAQAYQTKAALIPEMVRATDAVPEIDKRALTRVMDAGEKLANANFASDSAPGSAEALDAFAAAQRELSAALSNLSEVGKANPGLAADEKFTELVTRLGEADRQISAAWSEFNTTVQAYNAHVQGFPSMMVAPMMGFEPKPYLDSPASDGNL